ncbi:hypothetical protein [uncultured Clostridium sp.]|uniref:hypothetical protein n=1 Tax=uncultured Clostridium sp. TaxID=59620 RepID=UPI00261C1B78|nr:hypothetical protein [uncultured Clostridium sp.]
MMREELMRDILGEEFDEYGTGVESVKNLSETKAKLEARMEEIQNLFGEIAGDELKEKEHNEKYAKEYHYLNDEIQEIEEKLK